MQSNKFKVQVKKPGQTKKLTRPGIQNYKQLYMRQYIGQKTVFVNCTEPAIKLS